MIGIVFTTTDDAASFVRQHTDVRFDVLEENAPVQTEDVLVAITGKGKIKAALATERLLRSHDLETLLHTGTCTALNDEFSVGTMVGASFVLEGDRVELDAPTYPRMPLECPFDLPAEGTLVSQDHTADDTEEQSYWERLADVRDATGYAVAYVAAQHGIPCHIAKAVDTRIGQDAGTTSKSQSKETLAPFLQRVLENRSDSTN